MISPRRVLARPMASLNLALLLFVLIGCGDDPTGPGPSIVDTWERDTGIGLVSLTFLANGTLEATVDDSTNSGTYSIAGNQITLLDDDCGDQAGVYQYSVTATQLTLTLVTDTCERADVVPGVWLRT